MRFIICFITLPDPRSSYFFSPYLSCFRVIGVFSRKCVQANKNKHFHILHPHVLTFRSAALMHFQGAHAHLSNCRSRHVVCCWLCVRHTLTHIHFLSDPRYFHQHSFNGHSDTSRLRVYLHWPAVCLSSNAIVCHRLCCVSCVSRCAFMPVDIDSYLEKFLLDVRCAH